MKPSKDVPAVSPLLRDAIDEAELIMAGYKYKTPVDDMTVFQARIRMMAIKVYHAMNPRLM